MLFNCFLVNMNNKNIITGVMDFVYLLTYLLITRINTKLRNFNILPLSDNRFCQTCQNSTMDEALGPDGLTGKQNYL